MPEDDGSLLLLKSCTQLCKSLSNPVRLRLLSLLAEAELCSCHLPAVLGLPEATIRTQLNYLRRAGLVEVKTGSHWASFRLTTVQSDLCRRLIEMISGALRATPQLAGDRERLAKMTSGCISLRNCGGV
jgi:ArsR family transcriptional regulator, arsenate/arsenite/antimonite-responsive transcriptional repressor